MATGTLRGDGLVRAHTALAALEEDPQRLDRARVRFSDSPQPYTSHQSHNSTRSQSPNPPSEEQRRHEERRWQRIRERQASLPYYQLEVQESEEEQRLLDAHRNGRRRLQVGTNFIKLAHENVKKRWVEQGIWNDKWTATASGAVWKHEQPLEPEPELEAETEAETNNQPSLFSFSQPKPRRPKSDEENRQIAEQRATREREREASRPVHQFVYQVSKERERIQDELGSGEAPAPTAPADINTRAYENVKNIWIKRKIWNSKWGILPGMSWKHEDPLEEELADSPVPIQTDTLRNGNNDEAVEAPPARIFGSSTPAETNRRQVSSKMNASQRGQSANTESAGLANGDVEHSTLELNSASQRPRRPVPRPAVQTARASRRRPSHKDGQTQAVTSTSLGPVHISKVSKAPSREGPGARRRPNASEVLPSPDIAEPLLHTTSQPTVPAGGPRRSTRIAKLPQKQGLSVREPKSKVAPKRKRSGTASDEVKELPRSKLRRLVQETREEQISTNVRKRAGS